MTRLTKILRGIAGDDIKSRSFDSYFNRRREVIYIYALARSGL